MNPFKKAAPVVAEKPGGGLEVLRGMTGLHQRNPLAPRC